MKRAIIVIISIFVFTSPVFAKCISCSGNLVCEGDNKFDAISRCGQPDYSEEVRTDTEGSIKRNNVNISEQKVEKLYYNCGSGQFIEILTVKNGKIISIDDGDKGSGSQRCY